MENRILYEEQFKQSYSTPDSLRKLMKEISVQVLKSKPKDEDLYIFIAAYLNEQLCKRDSEEFVIYEQTTAEENVADGLHHNPTKAVSDINNLEWEKVNNAAIVIQRKFRSLSGKVKKEKPPGEPQKRYRSQIINTTIITNTQASKTICIAEECSSRLSESQNTLHAHTIPHKKSGSSVNSTSDKKEDVNNAEQSQDILKDNKGEEILNPNETIETSSSDDLFAMIHHAV